jgi:hypothetical protein
MLSYDLNCLAQCLELIKGSKNGTESITYKFIGEGQMMLTYTSIVNFANENALRPQVARESERSISMLDDALKFVKKNYKDSCGKALKCKELSTNDNIEVISTTFHSPRKVAYYRRFATYEIG